MTDRDKKVLEIGFEAGKKAIEMHPDDDSYDFLRLEEAQKLVEKLPTVQLIVMQKECCINANDFAFGVTCPSCGKPFRTLIG